MARADPFYIIRGELSESLNEVQQKLYRFHGLLASNPERKEIAKSVETECNSIIWQLNELSSAVDVAAENPARFNLTADEVASRRKWIENTRRQVNGIKDSLKTATATASMPPQDNRYVAANEKFVQNEYQQQQMIMQKQDSALDQMSKHIENIGLMGKTIGEELQSQDHLLQDLEAGVDTTGSRLKATQKRMQDLIRKSGSNTQLAVIIFLIVVLIILMIFAFY